MKRRALLVGMLLLTSVLAAPQGLTNTHWELVSVKAGGVTSLAPGGLARPRVGFQRDASTILGFGGCNAYRAGFSVENKRLRVKDIIATKVACAHLELESKFFAVLGKASVFVATPGTLLVSSQDGDSLLFTRIRMQ
ncbi:MAG: META domain-containing protein [Pleurocapsa sp. SU_196_0]|nr:META domain-containing protein [Pleurocapsa sp. SU_196_0]